MNKTILVCLSVVLCAVGSLMFPTPASASFGVSPNSINFGSVTVNTTSSAATIQVANYGRRAVSIANISSSIPQFIVLAPAVPFEVAGHSSVSIQVEFLPSAAVAYTATITVTSASGSSHAVTVSGNGIPASIGPTYLLTPSTSSMNFGSVLVGTSASQSLSVANTGTGSVTISQITVSGTAFAVTGFSGSVTLAPGQSLSLGVSFTPPTTGNVSGSFSVISNATNSPSTVSLSGTGVQPLISVQPTSANFGNVATGVTNTQTIAISNPGTANLTVSQATETGAGFTFSGLTTPLTISPGGSHAFTVSFTPTSASTFSGSLSITNNSPTPSVTVPLSGTGISATLLITANPTSLSFGSITTGTSSAKTVTLTNTGNANVSLSQDSVSGSGFSVTGLALPLTLSPGQTTSFSVDFAPTTTGSVSGSVVVTSNATNSPTTVTLSGTGTAPVSHTVTLSWTPSSSTYSGFNIYRGSTSGGPYNKINSSLVTSTSFVDNTVVSGQTYYYVATEVDTSGSESVYSNQTSASIP